MARKLAFINQKGGVGKTTLTANCGAYWALRGRRVLALDLDPQAHLSLHLGIDESIVPDDRGLDQVLRGEIALKDAIVRVEGENLDLVPASRHLSSIEHDLAQELGREMLLRDAINDLLLEKDYDLIIIDCPPSLGLLSLNALCAVDEVIVPVQTEFFALQGIAQLMDILERVKRRIHPGLRWRVFVPTLVDRRTAFGREVISNLREHFPGNVTEASIPKRVKIAEAPSFGKSIFGYAPESPGADDFARLAEEIEDRLEFPKRETLPPADPDKSTSKKPSKNSRSKKPESRVPESEIPEARVPEQKKPVNE